MTAITLTQKGSGSDSPASAQPQVCCYENITHRLQVVRITNIPNWYFEKVVFPQQRLLFEAPSHASLEVYTGDIAQSILSDHISCETLQLSPFVPAWKEN
jgi:hypothetical protein